MPTAMEPSFVAKRNECGMCFPIMHSTKVSFDETDFLCEVLCVFSEYFVQRHSILQWIGSLRLMMLADLIKVSTMRSTCGQVNS